VRVLLNAGRAFLPKQLEFIRSKASVRVAVGGYGSGKTSVAVAALAIHAIKNPWIPEYGEARPQSIVIGKTDKVIRDSSLRVFHQIVPRELIRSERRAVGERAICLHNGHEIIFRTWSGAIEGNTVTGAMLDEAHLLESREAFTNYLARARDPLCSKKLVVVAGLPEFGWLRDVFGPEHSFPDSVVFKFSAYDNTYLLPQDLERIAASCSSKAAETYMRGEWAAAQDAIYYEWDPEVHLVDDPGDPVRPCHLSIDVGERGAVLWWQERERKLRSGERTLGLHVIDEWLPENMSARAIMRGVLERQWRFQRGFSLAFVDPSTDRDEVDAIYEEIESAYGQGSIEVIRKIRGEKAYYREEGVRAVNAALRDANRDVRLTVHRGLPRGARSLITSIPKIRRNERTGQIVKDNRTDHVALDCLRYPVAHLLPLKGSGIHVTGA
jgi:hypothetical protein